VTLPERVPPHDVEAEIAVLGSCLIDPEAAAVCGARLRPEHFYRGTNGMVFREIVALHAETRACDIILLRERLERASILNHVGGMGFLSRVLASTPSAANVAHYAEIVLAAARRRAIIVAAEKAERDAYEGEAAADTVQAEFLEATSAASVSAGQTTSVASAIESFMARLDAGISPPIPSGFEAFDYEFGGIPQSGVFVIAGRPSHGKTSAALQLAVNVAAHKRAPALVFSLETMRDGLMSILLAQRSGIPARRIRRGGQHADGIRADEWPQFSRAVSDLAAVPMEFANGSDFSPIQVRSIALMHRARYGALGCVLVDYLQLLDTSAVEKGSTREREVAFASRHMKMLAMELECPVFLLSQLNRQNGKRTDPRPRLDDLRDSGAIEQDADVVMFTHRPELYATTNDEKALVAGQAEWIVAKYKESSVGTVQMMFDGPSQTFRCAGPQPRIGGAAASPSGSVTYDDFVPGM